MLHVRSVKKGRNQSVLFTGPKILVLAAILQGCPASRNARPAKSNHHPVLFVKNFIPAKT